MARNEMEVVDDSEWLPGELEYYQNMCDEIYPPGERAASASKPNTEVKGTKTQVPIRCEASTTEGESTEEEENAS